MRVLELSRLATIGSLCLALLGLPACGGGSGEDSPGGVSDSADFEVELEMRGTNGARRSSFEFGRSIVFALTITNRSAATQVLSLPTSQIYDLAVLPEGSATPRWRWSFNRSFQPTVTNLTYAGHQRFTYLFIWDGVLEDGTQIMPGNYDFRATLAYPNYSNDWRANHALAAPISKVTITD